MCVLDAWILYVSVCLCPGHLGFVRVFVSILDIWVVFVYVCVCPRHLGSRCVRAHTHREVAGETLRPQVLPSGSACSRARLCPALPAPGYNQAPKFSHGACPAPSPLPTGERSRASQAMACAGTQLRGEGVGGMHTCKGIGSCASVCVCSQACEGTYVHTRTCLCVYAHREMCVYLCALACACALVYVLMCVCRCIDLYASLHAHMWGHVHVQACAYL